MIFAKVIGTVVADARVSSMGGQLLRLVQLVDGRTLEPGAGYLWPPMSPARVMASW